jgi:hypothetical protein
MNGATAVRQVGAPAEPVGTFGPDRDSPSPHAIEKLSNKVIRRTQSYTENPQSFTEEANGAARKAF